jgi:hypothetical protein
MLDRLPALTTWGETIFVGMRIGMTALPANLEPDARKSPVIPME